MSIRRLPLQRLSYLVSYINVFLINRSRFAKEIFLTVKEVVTWRGKGIRRPLHAEREKHSERRKHNPQVFSIVNLQTVETIW